MKPHCSLAAARKSATTGISGGGGTGGGGGVAAGSPVSAGRHRPAAASARSRQARSADARAAWRCARGACRRWRPNRRRLAAHRRRARPRRPQAFADSRRARWEKHPAPARASRAGRQATGKTKGRRMVGLVGDSPGAGYCHKKSAANAAPEGTGRGRPAGALLAPDASGWSLRRAS